MDKTDKSLQEKTDICHITYIIIHLRIAVDIKGRNRATFKRRFSGGWHERGFFVRTFALAFALALATSY